MKVGYARVSTQEQNLDLQLRALQSAGCERIFEEKGVSGSDKGRPELQRTLDALSPDDVFVVWKLDRLGRSLGHLIELASALANRGVEFASISENIDTSTPGGKLFFHMMGALAEFERDLIVERTKAGMRAARARGKHLGRPRKLDLHRLNYARSLIAQGRSRNEVARLFSVHPTTLYRALSRNG